MDEASEDHRPLLPGQLTFAWGDEQTDESTAASESTAGSDSVVLDPADAMAPTAVSPAAPSAETEAATPESTGNRKSTKKAAGRRRKSKPGTGKSSETGSDQPDATASDRSTQPKRKAVKKKKPSRSKPAAAESPEPPDARTSSREVITKTAAKRRAKARPKRKKSQTSTSSRTSAVSKTVNSKTRRSSKSNLHEAVETIPLKWGAQFPKVGFGFWKVEQDATADVCFNAIKTGYRHLDCACDYGNEQQVGAGIARALKKGICDREDLWVTSKLWNTYHAAEHVRPAFEKSLNDLGLDYLDLYLIHFPIAQRFVPFEKKYPPGWFYDENAAHPVVEEAKVPLHETWQAMEELAKEGLVRNIGICNMGTSQIRDLLAYCSIRPAVLQVESHPYLTQEKLLRYCQQERIAYTAFSPLGAASYYSLGMADPSESVMENPVVTRIAQEVERTPAQVLLRWGVQRGTSVIPKTSNTDRMVENLDIFDFELSDQQMQDISNLNQNRRFNDPGDFGEAAFNTFLPIYE